MSDFSSSSLNITVFIPHVPVFFWPSWGNFGNIVLIVCICCQLPSPDKSPNCKNVLER